VLGPGGTRQTGPISPPKLAWVVKRGCRGMLRFGALGLGWIRWAGGRSFVSQAVEKAGIVVSNGGRMRMQIVKNTLWCERHIRVLKPVTSAERVPVVPVFGTARALLRVVSPAIKHTMCLATVLCYVPGRKMRLGIWRNSGGIRGLSPNRLLATRAAKYSSKLSTVSLGG